MKLSVPQPVCTLVLVEGPSDAAAVGALITRLGLDMTSSGHHIQIASAGGITNFSAVLAGFAPAYPAAHPGNPGASARVCGLYDVAEERHVRRALAAAAWVAPIAAHQSPESAGFFACVADLEDELIRALGTQAVEEVLEEQGELASFRRFQAMPEHRGSPVDRQLHRFLGTRATRKIRCAKLLVEKLDLANPGAGGLPRPFAGLVKYLVEGRRTTCCRRP